MDEGRIVEPMMAAGVAIPRTDGLPVVAIGVAAMRERMAPKRIAAQRQVLHDEALRPLTTSDRIGSVQE